MNELGLVISFLDKNLLAWKLPVGGGHWTEIPPVRMVDRNLFAKSSLWKYVLLTPSYLL